VMCVNTDLLHFLFSGSVTLALASCHSSRH